ncbi:hypothetical protein [Roseibium alexandrii]|uniref:hypothetical protein n=1 Tax=Roseibium alexandrii TaxID=388408 RepID=UPI0037511D42
MKHTVQLTVEIEVEVDEDKFTPDFVEEFNRSMFHTDCIEDHIEHLAFIGVQQEPSADSFIEGYGKLNEMGIKLSKPQFVETEIL